MKKIHKIIISLGFILVIFLIIFLSKDFVIRQYFIHKLENHDYNDEYILTFSINNKKSNISYYNPNFVAERNYDVNENLQDEIIIYEYTKNLKHQYNSKTAEIFTQSGDYTHIIPITMNNKTLLEFLKNTNKYEQNKFIYTSTKIMNNLDCYVFKFEDYQQKITTIYLDKTLLYTVRIDTYIPSTTVNNHIIWDYELDLNLTQKDLFNFDVEK